MLACVTEASTAYHVPVPAIERVLKAARPAHGLPSAGTGPMSIPAQWLPVLGAYGFPVNLVRRDACWGIAAGAWILAVETMYARPQGQHYNRNGYSTHIGAIPQQDVRWANAAAAGNHIPAAMLLAVAAQESGFNSGAVSPKGAQGLMQFMPGTWARYGHGSPFNPKAALFAGAAYLRHLALKLGSWPLAIAGYNAGGQAVVNAGYHIPPYRETQKYVPAVLARYETLAGLRPAGCGSGQIFRPQTGPRWPLPVRKESYSGTIGEQTTERGRRVATNTHTLKNKSSRGLHPAKDIP